MRWPDRDGRLLGARGSAIEKSQYDVNTQVHGGEYDESIGVIGGLYSWSPGGSPGVGLNLGPSHFKVQSKMSRSHPGSSPAIDCTSHVSCSSGDSDAKAKTSSSAICSHVLVDDKVLVMFNDEIEIFESKYTMYFGTNGLAKFGEDVKLSSMIVIVRY